EYGVKWLHADAAYSTHDLILLIASVKNGGITLTVVDLYTRECLGICVGQYLRSTEVAEMLDSIALTRPLLLLLKTYKAMNLQEYFWTMGI
ncbi:hypothetical protein ACI2I2_24220, partial [Scandinavium sp. NPDC088450]